MSSTPFATTGGLVCWNRVTNRAVRRRRLVSSGEQVRVQVRPFEHGPVGVVDASLGHVDVGAVHGEVGQRLGRCRPPAAASAELLDLPGEGRGRLLEACLACHRAERTDVAGQLLVRLRDRFLARGVDEGGGEVDQELVAGRPLDRPRPEGLAVVEDLLDPHVACAPPRSR